MLLRSLMKMMKHFYKHVAPAELYLFIVLETFQFGNEKQKFFTHENKSVLLFAKQQS